MNRRLPAVPGPNPLDCPHRPPCAVWNVKGGPSVRTCRMMTDHIRRALDMCADRLQEIKVSLAKQPFQADYSSTWWQDWYDRFVAELLRRGEFVNTHLFDASTHALIVDAEMLPTEPKEEPDRYPRLRPTPPQPREFPVIDVDP